MEQEYITISELNHYLKELFDDNMFLKHVYLKGEIILKLIREDICILL